MKKSQNEKTIIDIKVLEEDAKLKASGSSLNLTNEEMLTRTMSQINDAMRSGMSRDEAIQSAISQFETVANTEAALRKKYGILASYHGKTQGENVLVLPEKAEYSSLIS